MMLLRGCGSGGVVGGGATTSSSSLSSSRSSSSSRFRPPSVVATRAAAASSAGNCYGSSSDIGTSPRGAAATNATTALIITNQQASRRRRGRASPSRTRASGGEGGASGGGAGGSGDDSAAAAAAAPTAEEAYAVLGLDPASVRTFEDVVSAKNRAFAAAPEGQPGSAEARARAEAAYDLLFMRDMRRRLSGETNVSASVRYADVAPAPRRGPGSGGGKGGAAAKASGGGGGGGLGALFGGGGGGGGRSSSSSSAPVRGIRAGAPSALGRARSPSSSSPSSMMLAIRPVTGDQALQLAAVFGGLAALALAGALLEPQEQQARDLGALPLALAGAFAVYSLRGNPKRLSLARASGITALAAAAGALGGAAINAWLRVDVLPLGAFASPGVLTADAAILAIWAAVALLE